MHQFGGFVDEDRKVKVRKIIREYAGDYKPVSIKHGRLWARRREDACKRVRWENEVYLPDKDTDAVTQTQRRPRNVARDGPRTPRGSAIVGRALVISHQRATDSKK